MTAADRIELIDSIIKSSLKMFVKQMKELDWVGREDEAVSLFAFGCLLRHVGPTRFLRDARQIGIHVAVPQLRGPERKRLVRRDLVLWPEPGMSCWRSSGVPGKAPAAILQWKRTCDVMPGLYSVKDIEWLREFAEEHRGSVGYAVTLGSHRETPSIRCTRVMTGKPKEDWVVV